MNTSQAKTTSAPAVPDEAGISHVPSEFLAPLLAFYRPGAAPAPEFHALRAESVPQPYRKLLDHTRDMTGSLAAFHRQPIRLRVLDVRRDGDTLTRRVVLVLSHSGEIVEFGASRTNLGLLDENARAEVLAGNVPLGAILTGFAVPFVSTPTTLFSMTCDAVIGAAISCPPGTRLYGRCNSITTPGGLNISSVVEVLPLLDHSRH